MIMFLWLRIFFCAKILWNRYFKASKRLSTVKRCTTEIYSTVSSFCIANDYWAMGYATSGFLASAVLSITSGRSLDNDWHLASWWACSLSHEFFAFFKMLPLVKESPTFHLPHFYLWLKSIPYLSPLHLFYRIEESSLFTTMAPTSPAHFTRQKQKQWTKSLPVRLYI